MKLFQAVIMLAIAVGSGCSRSGDEAISEDDVVTGVADTHNSQNSLDWPGRYSGLFPCRDCEGAEITITLKSDGSFLIEVYGIGEPLPTKTESGQLNWHQDGRSFSLMTVAGDMQFFQVGENVLFAIDSEGNHIGSNDAASYRLEKLVNDPRIEDLTWFLVELRGQPVEIADRSTRPFLSLGGANGQLKGNASCNSFFGSYALRSGNRIAFSQNMGATAMECPQMQIESEFMTVLKQADNYAISDGELSLNRARMAPLARFRQ